MVASAAPQASLGILPTSGSSVKKLFGPRAAFVFGKDHMLVVDKATLAKEDNDFAELWPTLEYLAWCCYATGARNGTLKFATMGISVGQQLNRCKGCYKAEEIEAGDYRCRLLRAQVLLDSSPARPRAEGHRHG